MGAMAILASVLFLTGGGAASSSVGVAGGVDIPVQIAPWSVYVKLVYSDALGACDGAIVDARHVLTAAHCVYDTNGAVVSPRAVSIRAGISATYGSFSSEQDRSVVAVSVDPDYVSANASVAADDVALLTLDKPLDLTGPDVRAVALPRRGATPPVGAHVWLAGFGKQALDIPPDGALELINMHVTNKATCASFAASFVITDDTAALCASSPTTSVCRGDSGSGLVTVTRPRRLIGILSAGGSTCAFGSAGLYTFVGASEVRAFISGVLEHG
jgi:trypsin